MKLTGAAILVSRGMKVLQAAPAAYPYRSAVAGAGGRTTKDTKNTKGGRVMEFDELSHRVIGCAIEVHGELGPGRLESTYEQCLAHEFSLQGIGFRLQHPQPVEYKGVRLDCEYRIDMLVQDSLIVELKCVEEITGIHQAQLLTYLRLADVTVGLLMNFHVTKLQDGIKRFVL